MKKFFNTHKQELVMLPFLLAGLILFKNWLANNSPNTAQYDLFAEAETLFFICVKMIFFVLATWAIVKIVIPKFHDDLVNLYHNNFQNITGKQSLAIKTFALILFSLVFMSAFSNNAEMALRNDLNDYLHTQLDVRELTGKNDGPEVEKYLASVGLGKGYAWCAAFTAYNLNAFDVPNPNSAWSPSWAQSKDIIWTPKGNKANNKVKPGDCFTLYYYSLKRVGHVGFVVSETNTHFITIEGNTNDGGSREGDGVYKKKRAKSKVYAVTNYITPYIQENEKDILFSVYCGLDSFVQSKAYSDYYNYYRYSYGYENYNGERYFSANPNGQLSGGNALQGHAYNKRTGKGKNKPANQGWEIKSGHQVSSFRSIYEAARHRYSRITATPNRKGKRHHSIQVPTDYQATGWFWSIMLAYNSRGGNF